MSDEDYLWGIDISGWNRVYDFDLIAENVDFAYIKCTEGKTNRSKVYARRKEELERRGVLVGAYHYGWLKKHGINEPNKQAKWFCEHIGELGPDSLIPVLDMESGWYKKVKDINWWMNEFISYVEHELGTFVGIYTFRSFWRYKIREMWDRPLWLASTGKIKNNRPLRSEPKRSIPDWDTSLWQYSHKGRIPGIKGRVDLNRMPKEDLTMWTLEETCHL